MVADGLQNSLDEVVGVQLRIWPVEHFLEAAIRVFFEVLFCANARFLARAALILILFVLFPLPVVFSLDFIHLLAECVGLFGYFLYLTGGESVHQVFVKHPEFLLKKLVFLFFEGFLALRVIGLLVKVFFNLLLLLVDLGLLALHKVLPLEQLLDLIECQIWVFLEQLLL